MWALLSPPKLGVLADGTSNFCFVSLTNKEQSHVAFYRTYKTSSLSLNLANLRHDLHSYASASSERLHQLRYAYRRTMCWL